MSRFETEVLTQDGNVEGLGRLNAEWVDGAMSRTPHRRVILDIDSSESPVHGEQEGARMVAILSSESPSSETVPSGTTMPSSSSG